MWNINGFKGSKVQTIKQSGCNIFYDILQRHNFICFSETWRDSKDNYNFDFDDNFAEFHENGCRNYLGGRSSGSMSLMVRKTIINHVTILKSDSYHFWCKVDKRGFGWDSNLYFGFVYLLIIQI